MTQTWWLLDGAMLRGTDAMREVVADPYAVALYSDLGHDAASVGPWLVQGAERVDVERLQLPARLGVSQWHTDLDASALQDHARRIRHIHAEDGQRFYLRFADVRVLECLRRAMPVALIHDLLGPLTAWTWVDRSGRATQLAGPVAGSTSQRPVQLTDRQIEALLSAGLPDRLALALEELNDAALQRVHEASDFGAIESAATWLVQEGIDRFTLQRAVARQSVLSQGRALSDGAFHAAVRSAQAAGSPDAIDAWMPATRATA